jgi:hypothetical protein
MEYLFLYRAWNTPRYERPVINVATLRTPRSFAMF